MASTDTRSGFRLPWSSDRSHEDIAPEAAADAATETSEDVAVAAEPAWPQTDVNAALGLTKTEQRPYEPGELTPDPSTEEPSPVVDMDTAPAPVPVAPKKQPTKLMADLSAAIRATAEAAHEQALGQVEAECTTVIDSIRSSSVDGAAQLKAQSEDDIAAIREWSKAEIARIKEETDARITARKSSLDDELAGHAAAVERRVEEVRAEVQRFEQAMVAYRERLAAEDDPSRLATMAEEMPEPPSFAAWADLGTLEIEPVAAVEAVDAAEPDALVETPFEAEAVAAPVEGMLETAEPEAEADVAPVSDWYDTGEPAADTTDVAPVWGAPDVWERSVEAEPEPVEAVAETTAATEATADEYGDVPRWAAGETPEGFPTGDGAEAGDPVDRGAIMAALEAAAEAVVAAEAAAESADQAEAAADVAETAAELLVGRTAGDEEYDPEAAAAMAARVDAGGYDTESFTDRLASLLPGHDDAVGDEIRTTQVVVSGLVSVASIASFKRHLGRLPGVQTVAVASGPEGEFVFNVTHRADLSFRDTIPTMPGFAARVTNAGDGVVNVAARDPEAEG